ncbi:hypothetical protein [Streptomyces pratensis]|uniref:hypothetical protein n=1 Tax=Streptomyces pratensis TaxID=1169025 RepID=UPI0019313894|nr:hypothetical protein [Streptomyces pratensis]
MPAAGLLCAARAVGLLRLGLLRYGSDLGMWCGRSQRLGVLRAGLRGRVRLCRHRLRSLRLHALRGRGGLRVRQAVLRSGRRRGVRPAVLRLGRRRRGHLLRGRVGRLWRLDGRRPWGLRVRLPPARAGEPGAAAGSPRPAGARGPAVPGGRAGCGVVSLAPG